MSSCQTMDFLLRLRAFLNRYTLRGAAGLTIVVFDLSISVQIPIEKPSYEWLRAQEKRDRDLPSRLPR